VNRHKAAGLAFRMAVLFTLATGVALCLVVRALAHANLEASEPAAGSVLAESPAAVVLRFSEALDENASAVELRDSQAVAVVEGPGVIGPPEQLRLKLPPLPEGTYSAIWRVRSAVDGHITEGAVLFAVGADALPPSILPPPGTPEPATALPSPIDAISRWLNFAAAAVTAGALLFGPLVWRPAFQRRQSATIGEDEWATALLRRLVCLGCAAWAAATVFFVVAQARLLDSPELLEGAQIILAGRTGRLALARLGLLLVVLVLARRLPRAGSGRSLPWVLASATGAAALLTISLQSHSAALSGRLASIGTTLDWLHLLAMSAWLGGLLPLALLLLRSEDKPGLATVLVPRFTLVALPCVAILALTGFANAWLMVQTPEALAVTTHGRGLALKLGLSAILVALGAVNLFLLSPLLRREEATAVRRLGRTVRAELVIGAMVLLVVGVMTAVAPAFAALEAQIRLGFFESARSNGAELTLRVAPFHVGDNEFAVDVIDERPGAAEVEPVVLLRFSNDDSDIAEFEVETRPAGEGRFLARGAYLSTTGNWRLEAILRRSGFDDVRRAFELSVEAAEHSHNSG
jgi:copper transport protein